MKKFSTLLLMLCLLLWIVPVSAQTVQRGAFVIHEYHHDVSPPVRDLVSNDLFIGNHSCRRFVYWAPRETHRVIQWHSMKFFPMSPPPTS